MFFYNGYKVMEARLPSRGRTRVGEGSTEWNNSMEMSERSWLLERYEGSKKKIEDTDEPFES
ncbi:unnamed protein product [Acanthoscelides obtectus]|uniref:Uncharacterized protein n=1 Tax=Acanthoscelides obtectus TaxID=200917 RepID=A0A9P0PZL9_ACAOB|nr:unnamed protein product [Acanthoscelides obtectus]CAK1630029.1 hypothetical protein AOBTE_LOCUS6113 [Acanthoscelides obtectus]